MMKIPQRNTRKREERGMKGREGEEMREK